MISLPQRLGPYLLEARLGAGGMGEVFRARDERLERRVAIKLVRPEQAGAEATQVRFRREARAVAALNHPAIVQIHDVLETPWGDAIVMELVEGETLARRLLRGPLPLDDVLARGAEIAGGLAAAHRRGIVHRDLKPANVMLDAAGRAKILDFGLAKRKQAREPELSGDGALVGTYQAMSPEQARGLELDERSDLFALGLLLYEAATGRSPFVGSPYDVLVQICTARQAPLVTADPGLPPALSRLVDELLEKDPARRPQSATAVEERLAAIARGSSRGNEPAPSADGATLVGTPPPLLPPTPPPEPGPRPARRWRRPAAVVLAVTLAATAILAVALGRRSPDPLYVAVPEPRSEASADHPVERDAAAALRLALLRGLVGFEGVLPLAPEQVDPVSGTPVEVARAVAADEVLATHLACGVAACRVSLRRIRGTDGSVRWAGSFSVPPTELHLLADALTGLLSEAYAERRPSREPDRYEVSRTELEEYLRLRRGLGNEGEPPRPLDELIAETDALLARASGFLDAAIFQAELLRLRFRDRRDPRDLERAFELLRSASELAPRDPRPLYQLFEVALTGERLEVAEEALARLDRLQPGEPETLARRARLLERRGEGAQALDRMRQVVEQRPSWLNLFRLADMEYRQGETDAARRTLRRLLARFPASHAGRSLLAQLELLSGDPALAATLYSEVVADAPAVTELNNLGLAEMLLGRYGAAEDSFHRAHRLEPDNPYFVLNLADVVLLQGRELEAAGLYRRVLELTAEDPARSNWQIQSVEAQAYAHLGRRREAVERVQRVLTAAESNPQAAFEAALVYALVGEDASALVNAERALERGVEPRWFSFPWFDPLRGALPELTRDRATARAR